MPKNSSSMALASSIHNCAYVATGTRALGVISNSAGMPALFKII